MDLLFRFDFSNGYLSFIQNSGKNNDNNKQTARNESTPFFGCGGNPEINSLAILVIRQPQNFIIALFLNFTESNQLFLSEKITNVKKL